MAILRLKDVLAENRNVLIDIDDEETIQIADSDFIVEQTGGLALDTPIDGFVSGAGTVAEADTLLVALNKLNGNVALKAPLASPTFTGTVIIPTPFTLGAVSVLPTGTELNFVDGVTSAIQTQLDAKASLTSLQTLALTITKANILAMNGTPVVVVAAVADSVIEFVGAVLIYDFLTAAYADGGDVTINYDSGGAAVGTTVTAANSFAAVGDKVFYMGALNAAGGYTMPVNTGLAITNGTGAFTDLGTAAGVGRLKIFYRVHATGF